MSKEIDTEKREYEFEPPKNRLAVCMPIGIAVGIGLGSLLGLLIRNMGAGICFGVGLGMLLGFLIDIILEKIDK